jgi:hypothetical protein
VEAALLKWRALALAHLPQQVALISEATSHVDLWQLFKELVALAATDEFKLESLRPIFAYAWWCVSESGDPMLKCEIETFFYEDLPVYDDTKKYLTYFITPDQFVVLQTSLLARLSEGESKVLVGRFQ